MGLQGHYYMNDAPAPAPQLPESYPISYPDPAVSNCLFYNNDIQGSANSSSSLVLVQHSDWLTQLNLKMLDGGDEVNDMSLSSHLLGAQSCMPLERKSRKGENQQFVDKLRAYFAHRSEYNSAYRTTMQNELIRDADHLQSKAEKSDVVFRMVDTFNRNTIHVTVTWQLKNNSLGRRRQARDECRPPPVALRDSGLVHDRPLLPDDPVLAGDEHELR